MFWRVSGVAGELLLDTGALVSLLDRSQSRHRDFVRYFEAWQGPVVSTEAVLTEATHLLCRAPRGIEACLDFFLRGGATLVPASRAALDRSRRLVAKYADLPMDYADATLVALAEELETDLVFTTDRSDFEVYRWKDRRAFRVVP
jgi:predicted nucleic acid-binding protein